MRKPGSWRLALILLPLAAELKAAEPMGWRECLELARGGNAELKAARASSDSLVYQERAAWSGFLPQLSADLTYNRSTTSNVGFASSATGVVQTGSGYAATLSARQSLFTGLSDVARARQARANAAGAEASERGARARVSYALKSAYQGVLYASAYARLTGEIIHRRQENLRLVELRFQSGRENKGSVLLSQAYLEQARYDDLQARNARRVARAQLARALGLDDLGDREISEPVPVSDPPGAAPDFRSIARDTPEYRAAVAQESAADAAVTLARSQFFPTLTVNANSGRQGPDFFPDASGRWSVGVALSLPFFSGGKDWYSARGAGAALAQAESNRQDAGRERLSGLEQAFASWTEAVAKLRMDASFESAAALRAEIARRKYNNGLLTFEDWDIIENDLISRQKTLLQSGRDRVVAEAAWEQAQGKGALQ